MTTAQSQSNQLGIFLMIAASLIFAVQDGISRHLAAEYNVLLIVMLRYWFFAAFVCAVAKRQAGSIRAAARTDQPISNAEICVIRSQWNSTQTSL